MLTTNMVYANKPGMVHYQVPFIQIIKDLVKTYEGSHRQGQSFDRYVIDMLAKGDTIVDIGTHSFSYLYYLNKAVGSKGNLVMFETDYKRYTQFIRLQKFLSLKNMTIHQVGCLQCNTAAIITMNAYNKQSSPYSAANNILDKICRSNIQPALIRINTPADNVQILNGAIQLLKTCRPTIIIRCDERTTGREKVLSIFKFFNAIQYTGFFMLDAIKLPLQNFDFNLYQNTCSNFFCDQFVFEPS